MITTTIEKLPKICRSCGRLRCKSKFYNCKANLYNCKANLIFPKKPTCGRYKEHIKARFKRFLIDNDAFKCWIKNRENKRISGNKLQSPYSVLFQSFHWASTKEKKPYWENLNKKWQEIIKTEYPEYLPKG